jgi:hypothetical protein
MGNGASIMGHRNAKPSYLTSPKPPNPLSDTPENLPNLISKQRENHQKRFDMFLYIGEIIKKGLI